MTLQRHAGARSSPGKGQGRSLAPRNPGFGSEGRAIERIESALASLLLLAGCQQAEGAAGIRDSPPPLAALSRGLPVVDLAERRAQQAAQADDEAVPLVDLSGAGHPREVTLIAPGVPRLYSKGERTWVHAAADGSSARLGYLRAGSSSPVVGSAQPGPGCKDEWYPIAPRGFVCLDNWATLDPNEPVVRALAEYPPDALRKLPYVYGTVRRPGPYYAKLPRSEDLLQVEPDLTRRMQLWLTFEGEAGAGFAQEVWLGRPGQPYDPAAAWQERRTEGVPEFLREGQSAPNLRAVPRHPDQVLLGRLEPKAGYAFTQTFFWEGRRYGATTNLEVMPTDRFRPIRGSDFHGVQIGVEIDFPFVIVRRSGARFHSGRAAEYRKAMQLTGKQQFFDGVLHYETSDQEWISDRVASRFSPARRMPKWANEGERWIDISINRQALMLYQGTKPVYATLISSGADGLADPEASTATKRGIFRIHAKHWTTTMSSTEMGEAFELNEVPYVQYFHAGYALHGAYWHDQFGLPKSHGCINLSPEDARRIFFWSEPRLPIAWHGVEDARGSVVFIHP